MVDVTIHCINRDSPSPRTSCSTHRPFPLESPFKPSVRFTAAIEKETIFQRHPARLDFTFDMVPVPWLDGGWSMIYNGELMNNAIKLVGLILLLSLGHSLARADVTEDSQYWGAVMAQGSFSSADPNLKRVRWWLEGQGRLFEDGDRLGQSILRPGLGYALTERATVWLGYGWIFNSPAGAGTDDIDEHRIWQQLTWSKPFEVGMLSTRSRLEQRLVEGGDDTGWRFRQLVKFIFPFDFEPRFSLVGWDEIFVNINHTDWGARDGLDQNRGFVGLGWNFDRASHFRTEIGYLNQFIDSPAGKDRVNHILSATLFIRY